MPKKMSVQNAIQALYSATARSLENCLLVLAGNKYFVPSSGAMIARINFLSAQIHLLTLSVCSPQK